MKFRAALLCLLSSTSDAAFVLPSITVDGVVFQQPLNQSSTITQEQIEQGQYQSMADLLEQESSLQLNDIHGRDGQEISMQGFASNQVLIVKDGIPVNTGRVYNLEAMSLDDIAEVKIIRGAASAKYGNQAMGGVIEVTSKGYQGDQYNLTLDATSYLQHYTIDAPLWLNQQRIVGAVKTQIAGQIVNLSGHYQSLFGATRDRALYQEDAPRGQRWKIAADVTSKLSEHQTLAVSLNVNGHSLARPRSQGTGVFSVPFSYGDDELSLQGNLKHVTKFGGWTLGSLINAQRSEFVSDQDAIRTEALEQQRQAQFDALQLQQDARNTVNGWIVDAGYQISHEAFEQSQNKVNQPTMVEVPRSEQTLASAYLQGNRLIGDTEVQLGSRIQQTQQAAIIAPKLNAEHIFFLPNGDELTAALAFGKGYRVANLKERFYLFDHSQFGYQVLGNADLLSEQVWSTQGALTWQGLQQSLELNVFYNAATDLIVTAEATEAAPTAPGVQTFQYQNVDQARLYGANISHKWQLNNSLALNNSYQYLDARILGSNTFIPQRAKHSASSQLSWRFAPTWFWLTSLNYTGKQWVDTDNTAQSPDWWNLRAVLSKQFNEQYEMSISANNLLNQYQPIGSSNDLRPTSGTSISLKLDASW
ncbi:TonB-dependent receptor plug domain-containing protein [Salinibius halmophilus]|uniref:TonB-dependent receptor plug domain-containing protein n=1 Tax=Salinibius halmophilus TaxID=1853216 RepID=UPI000E65F94B|nr:TonB-dependent receptor [Salinibius halmophilus]